jgi:hypothetical protein
MIRSSAAVVGVAAVVWDRSPKPQPPMPRHRAKRRRQQPKRQRAKPQRAKAARSRPHPRAVCVSKRLPRAASSACRLYRRAIVHAAVGVAAAARGRKVLLPEARAPRPKQAKVESSSNSNAASVLRVGADRAARAIAKGAKATTSGVRAKVAKVAVTVSAVKGRTATARDKALKDAKVKNTGSAEKVSNATASGAIAIVDRGTARAASPSAKAGTAIAAIGAISRRPNSILSNRWSIAALKK